MNRKNYLNNFKNHFKDSYGLDRLNKYLFVAGLVLSLSRFTSMFGFLLVAYGTWRYFSKDRTRRYKELLAFEHYLDKFKRKYSKGKSSIVQYRQYKVFKCPNCSQKLRVPRKKGKLLIGCKKCDTVFRGKS